MPSLATLNSGSLKRHQLRRAINRLESGITTTVVYFGDSIMNGTAASPAEYKSFRALLRDWLNDAYSSATLTHVNSGVGGTSGWYGLVRLQTDVVDYAPELVIINFYANDPSEDGVGDRTDGFAPAAEAIIRRLRTNLPNATIVYVLTAWNDSYSSMSAGRRAARQKWLLLCNRYQIPALRFDLEIERLAGTRTPTDGQTETYFGAADVHPNNAGHEAIFDLLQRYMATHTSASVGNTWDAALPTRYYSEAADYETTPQITNGADLILSGSWSTVDTRIESSSAGDRASFAGTICSFGLETNYGGGAGTLRWRIDGGGWTNIDLSTLSVANNPIHNFTQAAVTVDVEVVSGTVKLYRFLGV